MELTRSEERLVRAAKQSKPADRAAKLNLTLILVLGCIGFIGLCVAGAWRMREGHIGAGFMHIAMGLSLLGLFLGGVAYRRLAMVALPLIKKLCEKVEQDAE